MSHTFKDRRSKLNDRKDIKVKGVKKRLQEKPFNWRKDLKEAKVQISEIISELFEKLSISAKEVVLGFDSYRDGKLDSKKMIALVNDYIGHVDDLDSEFSEYAFQQSDYFKNDRDAANETEDVAQLFMDNLNLLEKIQSDVAEVERDRVAIGGFDGKGKLEDFSKELPDVFLKKVRDDFEKIHKQLMAVNNKYKSV